MSTMCTVLLMASPTNHRASSDSSLAKLEIMSQAVVSSVNSLSFVSHSPAHVYLSLRVGMTWLAH